MADAVKGPDGRQGSRRGMLAGAASLAAVGALAESVPAVAAARLPIENDDDLERALPALSNWRRWGSDDQIGTLNFMTRHTRLAAAALIRTGRVVPLAREMSSVTPNLRDVTYRMTRYLDKEGRNRAARLAARRHSVPGKAPPSISRFWPVM